MFLNVLIHMLRPVRRCGKFQSEINVVIRNQMPEDTVLKEMQEQKAVSSQSVQSEIDSAVVE